MGDALPPIMKGWLRLLYPCTSNFPSLKSCSVKFFSTSRVCGAVLEGIVHNMVVSYIQMVAYGHNITHQAVP
jgi:hypothetical protein